MTGYIASENFPWPGFYLWLVQKKEAIAIKK
jgi:hypothetical protein